MGESPTRNSKWITRREHDLTIKNEEMWRQAHSDIHCAEEKARDAAGMTLNTRLENLNELRSEVLQDRGQFVTRREMMAWSLAILATMGGVIGGVVALVR
jgi:hypothetical protein